MTVAKGVMLARPDEEELGFASRPLHLMPIANKPVLFHGLEAFRNAGIRSVVMVVGGDDRQLIRSAVGNGRRWGLEVRYLDAAPDDGVVDCLLGAAPLLGGEPFVVQQGDVLVHDGISRLGDRFSDEDLDALVLRLPSSARPVSHGRPRALAALGGCFIAPRALANADERDLDLSGFVSRLRARGGRVSVEQIDGSLPCSGGSDALLAANRRALTNLSGTPVEARVVKSDIQGPVVIHPTAEIDNAVIRGPAIIGPRTQVSHSYVGPYTSIGADVRVEGAEVEHSIILDGAHLLFVPARLDSSIVGRDARIGREQGVPRAVRLTVGDRAEVTLA
jgi:glucose-1-phosphate thymidylyltransferase